MAIQQNRLVDAQINRENTLQKRLQTICHCFMARDETRRDESAKAIFTSVEFREPGYCRSDTSALRAEERTAQT